MKKIVLLVFRPVLERLLPAVLGVVLWTGVSVAAEEKEGFVLTGKDDKILVPAGTMAADETVPATDFQRFSKESYRRRLRESVLDLQRILRELTGGEPAVQEVEGKAAPDARGIFIGAAAENVFGPVGKTAEDKQAFRVVVTPQRVGLFGESDLATSYAIYELLFRLGCRWYVPGEMGECLPKLSDKNMVFPIMDETGAPATIYRGIWFSDDAYRRRNRLREQFDRVDGAHALENYITKEQRAAHPDWCAVIDGKRDPERKQLAWGNPEVADAIAEEILRRLATNYRPSMSLAPLDQHYFSEGPEDTALDAGAWDETMQTVAVSDRLIHLANQVAKRVKEKYPEERFGLLAYHQYVTPPVREKPDPSLVPLIAPITYNRVHSMLDDRIDTSRTLRGLIEGWGKLAPVAYRGYAFNLAEPLAPFPQIRRWSRDLPFLLQNNVKYWQTETFPNFDSSFHALCLANRLTWNPAEKPEEIIKELHEKFYGPAAASMAEYWDLIDRTWDDKTNLAGCGFSYLDRFSPEVFQKAETLLASAESLATDPPYAQRVKLARDGFDLFQEFMSMRVQLQCGELAGLAPAAQAYKNHLEELRKTYGPYFFSGQFGTRYFDRFWNETYRQASAIAGEGNSVLGPPIATFRFHADAEKKGQDQGWHLKTADDSAWQETTVGQEQWNQKGFMNYFGPMWYRAEVDVPAADSKRPVHLWISGFDDEVSVFVNGKPAPVVLPEKPAEPQYAAKGFSKPATFDISSLIKANEPNLIAILATRNRVNELGTGGLLGPVYLYQAGVGNP